MVCRQPYQAHSVPAKIIQVLWTRAKQASAIDLSRGGSCKNTNHISRAQASALLGRSCALSTKVSQSARLLTFGRYVNSALTSGESSDRRQTATVSTTVFSPFMLR